jgi:2-dehydropantoate 2-reductase
MGIEKVLICGLGAVGLTYANKLKDVCKLKILVNQDRLERYSKNVPELNNQKIYLDYITPDQAWDPDLIIISTKSNGLDTAIEYINNYIKDETIIISLINGISCENRIAEKYGWDKVLHSYFIGHSAVRDGNKVTQDGIGKVVFGSPYDINSEKVKSLENFFKANGIDYEIPEDIMYSLWLKYTLNVFSNQLSAILNLTFGEMKSELFQDLAKKVIKEVIDIAKSEHINGAENLERDSLKALESMSDDGKTSMLQDVLAGRDTEVDIFAGEIIRLGKKYGIPTPCNQIIYDMIKIIEKRAKV